MTLALVSEMDRANRATRLGWFEIARQGGYLFAPALAGWMLTVMDPVAVFTAIGLLSCLAFLPTAFMPVGATPLQAGRAARPGCCASSPTASRTPPAGSRCGSPARSK